MHLDGNQLWLFGTGTPDGLSVTIDALYPVAFPTWGADYDPDDLVLSPWGSFTLDYTDCDHLSFSYQSGVQGYGSGQRSYARLSKLDGTQCPAF